jgi:signal transduction histidine kinase/CheY-like chemotaxis protein
VETKKTKRKMILLVTIAFWVIVAIGVVYITELNKTVTNNITQNISELAEHDRDSIRNYVESIWSDLEFVQGKLENYHCDTILDLENQLNVECANSDFSHIYMVGQDGKVYTDKFVTYDPDKADQNGRIDLLPYFENGNDRVVVRFDDKVAEAGLTKESILYGVRLDNYSVEGCNMVALVGISDIGNIQSRLSINSFVKGGASRGYSSVIDIDGNYIVNVERTIYLNKTENFFDRVNKSQKSEFTSQEISEKMQAGDTFTFKYTNASGVERIVYCMPFTEEEINWYFISSVESTVFAEQNRSFLAMSLAMLFATLIVIILVILFAVRSQRSVIKANAEANARTAFLANMSHEIRTPLNGIIGLIYLMDKDMDSGEEIDKAVMKQRLSKAKETAEYLLSLINNILDISKLQAGKVNITNDVISPEIVTDAVWSMQKNNIENRGIKFTVEKNNIIAPWIVGDDVMLKQVLMNILSNAAKFTPKGGEVVLSVSQKPEEAGKVCTMFTCRDTGCGMSQDILEHIWDSFSQDRGSTDESIKGTGLGMAISKLLVDAMEGEIRAESKLGGGSTFYVTLHSEIVNEPPKHEPNMKGSTLEQKKILVVEDNELNAEILHEILAGEGFEVELAGNGQIALDKFRESRVGEYNLILMDLQMPVMDGCTATIEIRKLDREDAKTVPVFACTANNFTEDRERADASGMNDFLSKPIDVDELLRKLVS